MASLKAGTSYARVPEPGTCAFCLMLGSRGAVYTKETVLGEMGRSAGVNDWRHWVDASRQQAGQDTNWPRLKYCRIPRYTGDGMSTVFPGEKLPPLDRMPGHVLHGWRDLSDGDRKKLAKGKTVQGWPHDESLADGHRWDSEREGASKFPKDWPDQKIVDAIRDTIETPDSTEKREFSRSVWKEVDGQVNYAKWAVIPGGKLKFIESYPVQAPGKYT
ncbi:hypothetical protein [Corynebacterium sp.]|uniref:VG15 protein n=1 Tax=Corynebacterium sp. TaxID=1720 RepID=UPI0026DD4BDB|nr:hypothetical protein [Corynebacterium sp.]MDO5033071.1 hypothetical protein [Corynebacterium sp.]